MTLDTLESINITTEFSNKILTWFDCHGRKNLPWQNNTTPYHVWISEIMLQQTQVKTVIPYFENFISRFPNLSTLASANVDAVLHLWSGLGYYNRAHNLHKTAIILIEQYKGIFPNSVEELIKLPGVGRSTAGAILAISMNISAPILDGNVKRILSRYHAIKGLTDTLRISIQLWKLAQTYTPKNRVADYTQAIMDLGATICTRNKPACSYCPLQQNCQAHLIGEECFFPERKHTRQRPIKQICMLILQNKKKEVFLEKRNTSTIWRGLWSFPEIEHTPLLNKHLSQKLDVSSEEIKILPRFYHDLTHLRLAVTPVKILLLKPSSTFQHHWFSFEALENLGLPRPVQKLIYQLQNTPT